MSARWLTTGPGITWAEFVACCASSEYRCLLDRIPLDTIRTVVDLGAHVGGFVLLLKTLRVPLERVVCVEPNPVSRVKLRFNLDHNGIAAEILGGAVSAHSGRANMHVGKCSTGFSLLGDHPNLEAGSIEVEAITFDMLVDRYVPDTTIDLCKMDVEGAEFEILLSSGSETLTRCRFLICEIHTSARHKKSDLIEALERKGFAPVPVAGSATNDTVLFRNERKETAAQLSGSPRAALGL